MKKLNLIVLSMAALLFGRPAGRCTANTVAENEAEIADLKAKFASQQEELDRLRAAAALPKEPPVEQQTVLAMLCKGAGVDIADVRWRVQAGLEPEQAVIAAQAQKESDAATKAAKK